MSEYQYLKVEKTDGVARITLDRPKHNVLDINMMNELITELEGLLTDDELKCLVINGAGASFCAGVEVADHKQMEKLLQETEAVRGVLQVTRSRGSRQAAFRKRS